MKVLLKVQILPTFGVNIVTRTTKSRLIVDYTAIAKIKQQKKACFEANAGSGKSYFAWLSFLKKLMHPKGN
jgi:hypothetical protein